MLRSVSTALAAVAMAALWLPTGTAQKAGEPWGTLKGRIVWGGAAVPKPQKLNVSNDKLHCEENGPLFDTLFVVDPKTRGLMNVFVALKAAPGGELPVHPNLKAIKDKEVVLDQPRCLFVPRAVAMREGQVLVAKNSSPVIHNIRWTTTDKRNTSGSVVIPAGKKYEIKDLRAQDLPLMLQCNIHPWMSGRLAVYDHPYFAVTRADGSFEIKLAPAGDYRLTIYHEQIGWRGGGKPGKAGEPITIKAGGVTDLGDLKMALQ